MDFAHVFNGYRYHTKYDHIDYIPPDVLQRTGDNILALVQKMANSDELTNTEVRWFHVPIAATEENANSINNFSIFFRHMSPVEWYILTF